LWVPVAKDFSTSVVSLEIDDQEYVIRLMMVSHIVVSSICSHRCALMMYIFSDIAGGRRS
jgi:hypothetical protein